MNLRSLTWFLLNFLVFVNGANVRFTNVKCSTVDPDYISFEKCELKVLRRGIIGMNVHIALHQIPVTNITVNLALFKKANGYRPFLYNHTVNFCDFQANRKRYPFVMIFFDALLKDSNINHTCPYDHDIIVRNWVLKEEMFRLLPLPDGEYLFKVTLATYNVWRGYIGGYMSTKE